MGRSFSCDVLNLVNYIEVARNINYSSKSKTSTSLLEVATYY